MKLSCYGCRSEVETRYGGGAGGRRGGTAEGAKTLLGGDL